MNGTAPAFDDRHGLVDFLLGLWALCRPLAAMAAMAARAADADAHTDAATATAAATMARDPRDAEVLELLLGLTSFAWHLEVLFQTPPPALPASLDAAAPARLLR